ncbi:hypothetical protein HMPREF0971_03133 [Segatella oris F0302]|uniref:Uncharacterized protein n=1 Tax=Segatella oris F0302 TaxID=649760 RepID=D1QVU2_9BACT|nr:hypothetical protein HMPREF0971_03133 [Segatella oris F0302]
MLINSIFSPFHRASKIQKKIRKHKLGEAFMAFNILYLSLQKRLKSSIK